MQTERESTVAATRAVPRDAYVPRMGCHAMLGLVSAMHPFGSIDRVPHAAGRKLARLSRRLSLSPFPRGSASFTLFIAAVLSAPSFSLLGAGVRALALWGRRARFDACQAAVHGVLES